MPEQAQIGRIAILGVGLIGGSLALALKKAGAVREIVGWGRNAERIAAAKTAGVIDRAETDLAAAVADADIVVLGVPVGQCRNLLKRIQPHITEGMVLTDVGSTKCSVIKDAKAVFGELPVKFVPGHPIAGTEQSGYEAAFAELFEHRRVILTPEDTTDCEAIMTVRRMWAASGAQLSEMSADHHDEVLAATSHLPHVLAYALVDHLATLQERREIFEYAAGGFRDFTRIASSSPEMWRDIVHANHQALTPVLEGLIEKLQVLRDAIASDDQSAVMASFERAKTTRDRLISLAEADD